MNKRMRKFLVSLGMVVVLGTGNAFADATSVESQLAVDLKSAMDPADDYAVFADKLTTKAHIDGSIAANDATIKNTKIGNSNAKGNNTSYIVKLNEETNQDELFVSGHSVALDMTKNTIIEEGGTYYWVKEDGTTKLKLAANKSGLTISKITDAGLGTAENPVSIGSALKSLEKLSTTLAATESGDGAVKIVDADVSQLQKSSGTGAGADYFDITLEDTDNDGNLGVVVVNVQVPSSASTQVTVDRALRVGGTVIDNYNELAGKVLFNFVNEDGTPYKGNLTFNMGAGIVLAPSATVNITSGGNFDGSVLCKIFNGSDIQMHQVEFNLIDKDTPNTPDTPDTPDTPFKDYEGDEETGDILPWGAIAGVGLAASGLFLVNRKDEDEE